MVMKPAASGGLVYSTDVGRTCPQCRQSVAGCSCKQDRAPATSDGVVRVSLTTKGRGGKSVTAINGVPLGATALALLGKHLRSACGAGGTTKDGVIEIQGDHRVKVIAELEKLKHTVKLVGKQLDKT